MLLRAILYLIFLFCFTIVSFANPQEQQLITYHDSGAYQYNFDKVIAAAKAYIIKQVEQNKHKLYPQRLAVVLDIDETSLSNYEHFKNNHFIMDKNIAWKGMIKGELPAFPATLSLYNTLQQQKVAVFFVTGRHQKICAVTKKNLKRVGYMHWKEVYCRPEDKYKSVIPFKSKMRNLITHKGYKIIANIGDQYSDHKGGFAEKTFKLPNPFYTLQ
ncbi:MAG: hypothetical protein A3F18_06625 [Legionellales bacterium RIFCSPHIGHO2_12_FULL_37_14]|nr:MAG: hypothetical protein A3F18_06625 [Legionellales bacterium RIFCSPHIGHO2_12_FULL_37_14]